MEFTTLGKTGLKVSVAGLGCGGPSRLGMRNDPLSANHAIGMVKQALDLGVNFLDTAQNYGTEAIVGKAIAGLPREQVVISTKKTLPPVDHANPDDRGRCFARLQRRDRIAACAGPDRHRVLGSLAANITRHRQAAELPEGRVQQHRA